MVLPFVLDYRNKFAINLLIGLLLIPGTPFLTAHSACAKLIGIEGIILADNAKARSWASPSATAAHSLKRGAHVFTLSRFRGYYIIEVDDDRETPIADTGFSIPTRAVKPWET